MVTFPHYSVCFFISFTSFQSHSCVLLQFYSRFAARLKSATKYLPLVNAARADHARDLSRTANSTTGHLTDFCTYSMPPNAAKQGSLGTSASNPRQETMRGERPAAHVATRVHVYQQPQLSQSPCSVDFGIDEKSSNTVEEDINILSYSRPQSFEAVSSTSSTVVSANVPRNSTTVS